MNNSITNFIHCLSYLLRLQQPRRSGGMLFVHSLLELRTLPNELLVKPLGFT